MADPFNEGKSKPQDQFWGGSPENQAGLRHRYATSEIGGSGRELDGLNLLNQERQANQYRNRLIDAEVTGVQGRSEAATNAQLSELGAERVLGALNNARAGQLGNDERLRSARGFNEAAGAASWMRDEQGVLGSAYGGDSDRAMSDYNAGREATLRGAADLETYGRGAAAEYQSAADKAFQASQQRTQQNALALAAGRSPNSIRTALATAASANRSAALDQQAIKAQETNQLNQMRNQAIAQAAGIRSGVGAQDQQAAQLMAQRQQAATGNSVNLQGQLGQLVQADAQAGASNAALQSQLAGQEAQFALGLGNLRAGVLGQASETALQSQALRGQLSAQDSQFGALSAGQQITSGQQLRSDYLGAQTAMEGAQLGANMQNELQRQQWAKENAPANKFKKGWQMFTDPGGVLGG